MDSTRQDSAEIRIWTCIDDGGVTAITRKGQEVSRVTVGDWDVQYDQGLLDQLAERRKAGLPNETGGVLLGIADMSRKSIHIAYGLPQPQDSTSAATRGCWSIVYRDGATTAPILRPTGCPTTLRCWRWRRAWSAPDVG
jgi:hypothetical protein